MSESKKKEEIKKEIKNIESILDSHDLNISNLFYLRRQSDILYYKYNVLEDGFRNIIIKILENLEESLESLNKD